jgi:hypothetical protein
MTDPEFENELRERLRRAAKFAGDPSSAPETDLTAPAGGGRRPVRQVVLLAGVAATLVIAGGGAILALRSDPAEVVTTDKPIAETTSTPPVADPIASEPPTSEDVASLPTSLVGLLEPDTVRIMASAPIAGRVAPAYAWTGTELLIWGGSQPRSGGGEDALSDGAAYDPVADTWRLVSEAPIVGRAYPAVAWTGTEMIIWGGGADGDFLDDGAAYDPASDTWRRLPDSPLNGAMKSGAVWTGEELLIVGGLNGDSSGAAYNPDSDSWRRLPDAPGLITPPYPQAVWTGERAYFALSSGGILGDLVLAAYDPATEAWETIPHEFPASALPFLVWTGTEIIGITPAVGLAQGAYDPAADNWRQLPAVPDGLARSATSTPLPWTGQQILLWSGGASGLAFDVGTGQWRNYPAGDLDGRVDGVLVWADGVLLSWGGFVSQSDGTAVGAADGIVYAASRTSTPDSQNTTTTTQASSAFEPPSLAPGVSEAAESFVQGFLDDLRRGNLEAAAAKWTGYPDIASGAPVIDRVPSIEALLSNPEFTSILDDDVEIFVNASWGRTNAAPVVTVFAGAGEKRPAVAVGFLVGFSDEQGEPGQMWIHRLPTEDSQPGAPIQSTVDPGGQVTLPGVPVEGGGRAYLNETEISVVVDHSNLTTTITIPDTAEGTVAITLSTATPELSAVQVFVLTINAR